MITKGDIAAAIQAIADVEPSSLVMAYRNTWWHFKSMWIQSTLVFTDFVNDLCLALPYI
jgi:hypothetical protein